MYFRNLQLFFLVVFIYYLRILPLLWPYRSQQGNWLPSPCCPTQLAGRLCQHNSPITSDLNPLRPRFCKVNSLENFQYFLNCFNCLLLFNKHLIDLNSVDDNFSSNSAVVCPGQDIWTRVVQRKWERKGQREKHTSCFCSASLAATSLLLLKQPWLQLTLMCSRCESMTQLWRLFEYFQKIEFYFSLFWRILVFIRDVVDHETILNTWVRFFLSFKSPCSSFLAKN